VTLSPPPLTDLRVSTRVSAMDESPRGRILQAAARLFGSRGFGRTTVRELAAEVGIQSGSLFHHFKSKDEILEAVMVEVIELNTGRMLAALAHACDPLERLRVLLRCEINSITGDTRRAMSLLVNEWNSLDAAAQARVLVLRDRYEKLFLDAIADAANSLVEVEPFILRRLIYGVHAGLRTWFNPDGALSRDDLVELVMQLVSRKAPS